MKYGIPFLFILSVALTACVSPELQAEQARLDAQEDINRCASYGLRPNTDAFAQCRMQLDLARRQPVYYDSGPRVYTGFYYGHGHWR